MSGPWNQYCGPPPVPAELSERWNLDPYLIAAMAVVFGLHLLLSRSGERAPTGWPWSLLAAWVIVVILFVSPLCALSSALYAARTGHHVLLVAVVAPLAALSLADRWRLPIRSAGAVAILTALHVVVLWLWHAPPLYAAAMTYHAIFWAMQLGLLTTALTLWLGVLSSRTPLGFSLAALLGAGMQMGLLGALITFAPRPLYPPHFSGSEPFGLSALADQQLAGLIMWVPALLPYLAAALALLGQRLEPMATVRRSP